MRRLQLCGRVRAVAGFSRVEVLDALNDRPHNFVRCGREVPGPVGG